MKRNLIIIGAVIVTLLLVASYLFRGSTVPSGQQPLVRLNSDDFDSLKQQFNRSAQDIRVILLLSPT